MLPSAWLQRGSSRAILADSPACERGSKTHSIGHACIPNHQPLRRALPILSLVLLASCADPSAPVTTLEPPDMYAIRGWGRKIVSVKIAPDTGVVAPGQSIQFTAAGRTLDGRSRVITVAWAATGGMIDSTGLFTADSTPGSYQVIGTEPFAGLTDTAAVINALSPAAPPPTAPPPADSTSPEQPPADSPATVASISVTPASPTLAVGEGVQLAATAKDANGVVISGLSFSWATSNSGVVSVSSSGVVRALAAGSSVISATTAGVAGRSTVTVEAPVTSGSGCGGYPHDRLVSVSNSSQLSSAITGAQPGDLIELAAGTYSGRWKATASGTSGRRIVLCGPQTAVLNGGDYTVGNGLALSGVQYWTIKGITITNSLVGIAGWKSSWNVIDEVVITRTGQAGIHLRTFSRQNLIIRSKISDTGNLRPQYGEGVYIGSDASQWCTYTNCQPDRSDSNRVERNEIGPNVRADLIDVKAGTTGNIVRKNTGDGSGMVSDPSNPVWVLANGNRLVVDSNTFTHALTHGIKVRSTDDTWALGSLLEANTMNVGSGGYAIVVQTLDNSKTTITCDNVSSNAGSGLSNIACKP